MTPRRGPSLLGIIESDEIADLSLIQINGSAGQRVSVPQR